MMFMMPMPPTNSEMAAMPANSTVKPWVTTLTVLSSSAIVCRLKSSSSSARMPWRWRSTSLMRCLAGSRASSDPTRM
ncbi:hypothetical protein D3C72_492250 [compost metagenome]